MFANIDWEQTFAVVITGLVVVFSVLLILVFLCWVMAKIFTAIDNNKSKPKADKSAKEQAKSEPKQAAPVVNSVPVVEDGIGDDIIAAISGAIACIMGADKKFALKSVKRSRGNRSTWNAAGIAENTRPF